jgi:AT hook motif
MAEKVMVICDVCGAPASEGVRISTGTRSVVKDLCAAHLAELFAGSHAPRRGRPRTTTSPGAGGGGAASPSAPKRRGRPPKAPSEAPVTKRRGRPPKAQASGQQAPAVSAQVAKPRRRITDPVILERRRAALVKARQARADKRAAASAAR